LTNNKKSITIEISLAQKAFLDYCKEFGWGKLEITVKNGEPVMANIVVEGGIVRQDTKFD